MFSRLPLLAAICGLALVHPVDTAMAQNAGDTVELTNEQIKKGWKTTKQVAVDLTEDAAELAEGTETQIRKLFTGPESAVTQATFLTFHKNLGAASMIGNELKNNEEQVGSIRDIHVNESGEVLHLIVDDGSAWSMGDKTVAIDYDRVSSMDESGDIYAAITEGVIKNTAAYDPQDHDHISLAKLLDGEVIGDDGRTLASVENVVIQNGTATHIIVTFNDIFEMGGEELALDFGNRILAAQESETDVVLSAPQTLAVKSFIAQTNN